MTSGELGCFRQGALSMELAHPVVARLPLACWEKAFESPYPQLWNWSCLLVSTTAAGPWYGLFRAHQV